MLTYGCPAIFAPRLGGRVQGRVEAGQLVDALVQAAVGVRDRDRVVGSQLPHPNVVEEPPQDQDRLLEARQPPTATTCAQTSATGVQQR